MNHSINDSYVNRIAKHLIVNSSFMDNLGLFNGKMGIVIFFYHFAKYSQKNIYYDFANKLLDEIYSEIHSETPINLKNGLCGIGVGMEYLLQNNFLEGDSDEVLADIDKKIMEKYPLWIMDDSFQTGAGGILYYVLVRLFSTKRQKNDLPFTHDYLSCWEIRAKEKYINQNDLGFLSNIFLKWKNNETIEFDVSSLIYNLFRPCADIDEDFVYLPYGLNGGSAGIGMKNILL